MRLAALLTLLVLSAIAAAPAVARAATAEEVFRGASEALDAHPPALPAGAVLCVLAGAAGVAVVWSHRRGPERPTSRGRAVATMARKPSPRRVLRLASRSCGLGRREVRHLRRLAAEQGWASPTVGLLCPSLIEAAIRSPGRANREVLSRVLAKARAG